jgi:hypothetical protein
MVEVSRVETTTFVSQLEAHLQAAQGDQFSGNDNIIDESGHQIANRGL